MARKTFGHMGRILAATPASIGAAGRGHRKLGRRVRALGMPAFGLPNPSTGIPLAGFRRRRKGR